MVQSKIDNDTREFWGANMRNQQKNKEHDKSTIV